MNSIIFYAPNVYFGGGRYLLLRILKELPKKAKVIAILNAKISHDICSLGLDPNYIRFIWIRPSIKDYIAAELLLLKKEFRTSTIFCFHGLPPTLCNSNKIIVYAQNRLLFESQNYMQNTIAFNFLIFLQKIIWHLFLHKVRYVIVQTNSMSSLIQKFLHSSCLRIFTKNSPKILVYPFASFNPTELQYSEISYISKKHDFIYPATVATHKNHANLIKAWLLLANEGLFPSLVLATINTDTTLSTLVEDAKKCGANIQIVNGLKHHECLIAIKESRALIYPSLQESYGLPLVEASILQIPILASNLGFVTDVCKPYAVFDPLSAQSIAKQVKNFKPSIENTDYLLNDNLDKLCELIIENNSTQHNNPHI